MDKISENQKQINHPLKRSILTNMIVIPFIPFLLAIGVSFYYFATTLEQSSTASLKRIVEDHCHMIDSFLMERQSDLELITNTYSFDDIMEGAAIDGIFENLKKRSGAFVDLGLFNSRGIHKRYAGKFQLLKGKEYRNEVWFKKVMQTGYYISDIFSGYRNVPHFIIAVKQGADNDAWVLRATIDTLVFDRLVSKVRIGKTGESYILNSSGISQTERRSGGIGIMEKDPEYIDFPHSLELSPSKNGIETFIKTDPAKDQYLYATTRLKNKEWLLVVRQEKKDAYKALYSAMYITLLIMVVGGAVIIVTAIYMTEHILKRMDTLGMEKESLGNQLIRAVQLAEIGEMAAGFAHEINNPLQIIKGEHLLVETLMKEIAALLPPTSGEDLDEIQDSMDQIKLQVNRCSEITHAILKFGRKNDSKPEVLNPCDIIPEIIHMVEKKAHVEGIDMRMDIAHDTPRFQGDASQFQQVILNLVNNAMDAIAQAHGTSGGLLSVTSEKTDQGDAQINISDNGVGIGSDNIGKIFSPFFTTKPVGKGTGLGLSVCYGIIKNLGGTMTVKSEQGKGTTFVITLPAMV
ncbi:two-component system, NtrC family, sensor kinase [Desulfocicer vacuolatum DSM 3385]|uniref:histidine kinase n=1 Tax=Desulfocicer vacuolatum DSM 3385 TaxID=1121400 RepID=A0A1W1YU10_9BACT|nr:sensor histidine kinase [Desulfocicer vacuolatum]SMC39705.1 two-component system, NtrC family, sensor kinase [Desulfocicer vacuolatum DSM 3385]